MRDLRINEPGAGKWIMRAMSARCRSASARKASRTCVLDVLISRMSPVSGSKAPTSWSRFSSSVSAGADFTAPPPAT